MLSLNFPKFNLQYESAGILDRLLETIVATIPKDEETTDTSKDKDADNNNKMSAFRVSLI